MEGTKNEHLSLMSLNRSRNVYRNFHIHLNLHWIEYFYHLWDHICTERLHEQMYRLGDEDVAECGSLWHRWKCGSLWHRCECGETCSTDIFLHMKHTVLHVCEELQPQQISQRNSVVLHLQLNCILSPGQVNVRNKQEAPAAAQRKLKIKSFFDLF